MMDSASKSSIPQISFLVHDYNSLVFKLWRMVQDEASQLGCRWWLESFGMLGIVIFCEGMNSNIWYEVRPIQTMKSYHTYISFIISTRVSSSLTPFA
jgi:hypothetical protein